MTEKKMYEKFSWFRDDVRNSSQVGNKLRIKGRALCATISRNDRKYIKDELLRSARTLAGKPIDVNHAVSVWEAAVEAGETILPKPKHVGHVIDADYEDGFIEYVAEINDNEYVAKLRDRESLSQEEYFEKWEKNPIYGVSVDAVYRYPQSETEKDDITIPLGIQFIRLSLVEDPETPGVKNTTIELMEKSLTETRVVSNLLQDFAPALFESYQEEVVSKMSETTSEDKPNYVVSDDTPFAYDPLKEHPLPRGDIPDSEYSFGESTEKEEPGEESLEERFGLTEEQLGEPHAGYSSFDDCVSKNQGKDDPDAYCAEIWKTHEVDMGSEEETSETIIPEVEKGERTTEIETSPNFNLTSVDKVIFKPLTKTSPQKEEKAEETVEEKEKEMPEVKPLEKREGENLREKQERELAELETKQFRDRNEAEHKEFREIGQTLADKINEVLEARPKDAEILRELFEKRLSWSAEVVETKLGETITELEGQNQVLKTKNDELVDVINAQKDAIESLGEQLKKNSIEREALMGKDGELVEASNAQKTVIESYEERIKELETEKDATKETAVQLAEKVEAQHTAIEGLEAKLGEFEEFKSTFDTIKADFETRIASLEEFKEAYGTERAGTQEIIDQLTERADVLNTKLEEMTKKPEENPMEEKIEKITEIVENLRTHVDPKFKTPENLDPEESESNTSLEVDPTRG